MFIFFLHQNNIIFLKNQKLQEKSAGIVIYSYNKVSHARNETILFKIIIFYDFFKRIKHPSTEELI